MAIATGLLTLVGVPGNGNSDGTDLVDQCMSEHGMSRPAERRDVAAGRVLFRACESPPPPGAASDGYTEITVASGPGPGQSEAEGMTVADVFTTSCRDIEVKYLFDNMGTFVTEQPVLLSKGEVRRVEGGSVWSANSEREDALYMPGRDESIVMSAGRYQLDSARCVE